MSVPGPVTVHVPAASDWSPITPALPTSAQLQPGQGEAAATGTGDSPGAAIAADVNVARAGVAGARELVTTPCIGPAGSGRSTSPPGTSVNRAPSVETAA